MTAWSVLFLCLAPPRPTGPDCLSLTTPDRAPLPPSGRGIQTATARGTTVIPHLVVPRPPAPGLPPAPPRGRVDTFRPQRSRRRRARWCLLVRPRLAVAAALPVRLCLVPCTRFVSPRWFALFPHWVGSPFPSQVAEMRALITVSWWFKFILR